jgi:hypothetical protein
MAKTVATRRGLDYGLAAFTMTARRFWRLALFGQWMRAREIAHTKKEDNRIVRPFAWGLEFVSDHVNGDDPRNVLREHTRRAMADSDRFYSLPPIEDYALADDRLTWTSAIQTPSAENNIVRARLFTPRKERKNKPRAAVVVLHSRRPADSHLEACHL